MQVNCSTIGWFDDVIVPSDLLELLISIDITGSDAGCNIEEDDQIEY